LVDGFELNALAGRRKADSMRVNKPFFMIHLCSVVENLECVTLTVINNIQQHKALINPRLLALKQLSTEISMFREEIPMPNTSQLPHLITLLEDESLRPSVLKELASFGPSLEHEIKKQKITVSADQARLIRPLLDAEYRTWLQAEWKSCLRIKDDKLRLELAQSLLAQFQFGKLHPAQLSATIDELVNDYESHYSSHDALDLAEFLFRKFSLTGVQQEDYYNPLNSNLLYVIEQRKGIPISLGCIYILVGHRLGLPIEGCNMPGHFLAVASPQHQPVLVDCFNGGMLIDAEALKASGVTMTFEDVLQLQCNAYVIIARVLRNLTSAYEHIDQKENAATMVELLIQTEQYI
jgi:regulator of sirC expression with transglutaminase-like and TPR domain